MTGHQSMGQDFPKPMTDFVGEAGIPRDDENKYNRPPMCIDLLPGNED